MDGGFVIVLGGDLEVGHLTGRAVRRWVKHADAEAHVAGGQSHHAAELAAADDADGSGFLVGEAQDFGTNEGEEDAQLCGSAQQQAGRTCDQRLKVGHGTDAKENQRGIDTQFDA